MTGARRDTILLIVGLAVVVAVIVGGITFMAVNEKQVPDQTAAPLDLADQSARHFLDRYVDPDGRVVRRDQGNDTVSEGQAYAMLTAVALRDRARFDSTWNWSKSNLMQPNGLLAWKWNNGKVTDASPASDADLDAARALVIASRVWSGSSYADEAKALANAIQQYEVIKLSNGTPVLLAGPWATTAPHYVNPSYTSPRAFDDLGNITGDSRWSTLADAERARTSALIQPSGQPVRLPSDWATVADDGSITPASPPGDSSIQPRYSYDALRTPVRLAESCDTADRQQAQLMFSKLNTPNDNRTSDIISLDGKSLSTNKTAPGAVGTAGGAKAADDGNQVLTLLQQADDLEKANNTYYGAAWAALGRIMLTTDWLGSCS